MKDKLVVKMNKVCEHNMNGMTLLTGNFIKQIPYAHKKFA